MAWSIAGWSDGSLVDREFDSRPRQTKKYIIGICCFIANYTVLITTQY